MKRRPRTGALVITAVVLATSVGFVTNSCSGVNLDRHNWEREYSRPLDCFPHLADGVGADHVDPNELALVDSVPFDLTGVWAQQQITTLVTSAPLVGESLTTSTNTLRMVVEQDGRAVTMTAQVCGISQHNSSNVGTSVIPQSFIDTIGVTTRTATIEAAHSGYRYREDRYVRVLGVDLEDELNDPVPEHIDDPRVVDCDGDGNPGITVLVEGLVDGEVYLVQRHWEEQCGDVISEDAIDGYILWNTDQCVVEASNFVLNRTPDTWPHPDWEKNRFRLRRVDPAMTCEDILANQEQIFAN